MYKYLNKTLRVLTLTLSITCLSFANVSASVPITNELLSVDNSGNVNNNTVLPYGHVYSSHDGRYAVFSTAASNLVSGDTNNASDIFVRDRQAGTTTRVNLTSGGLQSSGGVEQPYISYDGRYISFSTWVNLLGTTPAGTTNYKIYRKDMQTGVLTVVSAYNGLAANADSRVSAMSADGRFLVFESTATNIVASPATGGEDNVYIKDMETGVTKMLSTKSGVSGNGQSTNPSISCDGSKVAFTSVASNLVTGDTNGKKDIFLATPAAGGDGLVNLTLGGDDVSHYGNLSCNSVYLGLGTNASNIGPAGAGGLRYNGPENSFQKITDSSVPTSADIMLSNDGRYASYNYGSIFLLDIKAGTPKEIVSKNSSYTRTGCLLPFINQDGTGISYICAEDSNPLKKMVSAEGTNVNNRDAFYSLTGI